MPESSPAAKPPLDEVMLAMDVVDTLRHRQLLVERELSAEDRDKRLLARLKDIYAAQGIEVPEHVLAEGVQALNENRFTYEPAAPGLATWFAHRYVERGTWGKVVAGVIAVVAVVWLGYAFLVSGPAERRLEDIPRNLAAQQAAVVELAQADEVKARAVALQARGKAALDAGDVAAAEQAVADLEALRAALELEYELRIVSRPDELSGVWRVPEANPDARNYYIIVEAVTTADGKTLTLPIRNEEDGRTYQVDKWALRVDGSVFRQIEADKRDDGIIQNNRFGVKRRGRLEPDYLVPTTGAALTSW